ncbi:50S ribosomal protein L19 [Candidatus Falkowbacteria bacterium CG10_big_fil_rev_8_21_14_0_10_39_11]|uniref:50S ribosomal protein L19 n=1 Tax=Candidatus Falkowbacteria bacterium CG10_big_fil_rev_8_21_14_0_10_39_11 TaxID=1974565 RepID=A0A2H0V7D0_9BACT|nr:MAG: 50S ribosomal protein L19 [Candidatus Falkowbacteria bacterium CG10_big_fil_rev_8_21_14_0_10_39_11]
MTEEKTTDTTSTVVKEAKLYPDVTPGSVVKVHETITETNPKGEEKQRIQIFEGIVLQRKHGKGINATITVRKVSGGIGVEKIYPLSSPIVEKIEVVKRYQVRRAKLSYLRNHFKKLKEIK